MNAIEALKLAYRKHHLGDESIGWDELSECLLDALCNELGDDGYQEWLASNKPFKSDANYRCECCGKVMACNFAVCDDCATKRTA